MAELSDRQVVDSEDCYYEIIVSPLLAIVNTPGFLRESGRLCFCVGVSIVKHLLALLAELTPPSTRYNTVIWYEYCVLYGTQLFSEPSREAH